MRPLEFRSDNAAPAADYILDAVREANSGTALAYGGDDLTAALQERATEVFGRPAHVFPVVTGTGANALGLAAMCPPWGAVLCHTSAHIVTSEAGAMSGFSGGAAMVCIPGDNALIEPAGVTRFLDGVRWDNPHESQPTVISVTQPTEAGTVYPLERIAALAEIARDRGLLMHLDGARLANAIATLGCTPAQAVADVQTFSLGATKNGALSTDAIVTFDERVAEQVRFRLQRAGHVPSKMRFASAQLLAYLADDRWLATAAAANRAMTRLAAGVRDLGFEIAADPQANLAFVAMPGDMADRWAAAGVLFYRMGPDIIRLVTNFATTEADVDDAIERLRTIASR